MPTELNRIRELSGLQQEAPASGDQALANELSSYFAKLAKEMLQNMQRPNTDDVEYEEFVDIAQAFKGGIQAGLDEVNLSGFEFSSNPFGDFGRSINDGPDEELVKILAKYGYRPGPDGDNDEATIVKQQEESAVQEAPGAEINNSTMPTELNRIKELAGLQQEAAVGLTAQQKQGLDAINAKYGKYIGYGNGGSLPVEAMERAIDPGSTLWADDKEENELKAYMKKMGYKDLSDMESKDEEYVDNVQLPISDAMADDLQKVLGDYNDNSGLAQAAKDYLGSLPETAVAEVPAAIQPTPVLNAVKETPAMSQVDEAIKKARAQLKSFSNFDGLKPYKPKNK